MLRLGRGAFFRFCNVFRERGLLQDTIHLSIEQQVAMFLNTIGHNLRTRLVATNFDRSTETTSRYFNLVLHAIGQLHHDYMKPPSLDISPQIAGNHRWDPFFQDCIGAIDGTHVRCSVSKSMEPAFRGRKPFTKQNVLAAVDFSGRFAYVLAGWEGTAHDATVLKDALERPNGLRIPTGKYYLVDAGYGAKPGANGDDIPDGLHETLCGLEGYNEDQVSHYYDFLVDHPKKAKGFMAMGHKGQLNWMARYIKKVYTE